MIRALQLTEDFQTAMEAREALDTLRTQAGCLGGRILQPGPTRCSWGIQAFFQDEGISDINGQWLPDGLRRVVIPDSIRERLGIR